MTRSLALALMVVSSSTLAVGAEPGRDDLARLQGRWEAKIGKRVEFRVALEIEGKQVSATVVPSVGPKVRASGEIKLDEQVSPRSLDWVNFATLDGQDVPKLLSIYRLEGDRLTVKNGGFNDSRRPKTFEGAGEGIWAETVVFTRVHDQPKTTEVTTNP